jgi:potassium-dependent mechanosensitive channel
VIPPVGRPALLLILVLAASSGPAPGQQASATLAKPSPAPTPIPLAKVSLEAQSALALLQEIGASVARDQSTADDIVRTLSELTSEIDVRIAGDTKLLATSPSLDVLYQIKLTWHKFGHDLSVTARELTQHATRLEEQLARLVQMNGTWQATLQSAKQPETPLPVAQRVQDVADSVERTRQTAESGLAQILTLQTQLSGEEARARTVLSSIEHAENRALRNLLVRNRSPLWNLETSLGTEWEKQSGASFSSELKASTSYTKRLPFAFLIHALLIVVIAAALHWMRHRIRKLADEKPDLHRALPILDLPVSTAFVLSILIIPSNYAQAPPLIHAIIGAVALFPTVVILRRLLEPRSYPVVNALVILYFVSQIEVLAAPLPILARLIFLSQMLGASLFLVWLLRSLYPPAGAAEIHGRFWRAIRAIAKIGLILLPGAFLANVFGYNNLGNLLGIVFLRSVYIAALLYTAIRIIEGLITIALQVQPLGSLRVISLYRPMIQRRTCHVLEFLAFLFWLNLVLNFFGLRDPLIATTEATLNANLAIGSLNTTLGRILAFLIAVCASFLTSKFLRFLLEEDVYHHLHLASGIPYAISTVLHYVLLLLGFFIGLGALGIDLTKITILAGAFSVGIGFGLQNVVNNFVSGLILLFERPIKMGDVIEVSGNVGEVERIGIRASVLRTADGSEVIVPNGSLISSQVTNWTLSDRKRAVEISVSVVGSADSRRVVELLKTTAAGHPDVAKEPSPQVYIINFAAAVITFQLRVWTDRYQSWAQLRSDLSVAVNDALAREKIAIA